MVRTKKAPRKLLPKSKPLVRPFAMVTTADALLAKTFTSLSESPDISTKLQKLRSTLGMLEFLEEEYAAAMASNKKRSLKIKQLKARKSSREPNREEEEDAEISTDQEPEDEVVLGIDSSSAK